MVISTDPHFLFIHIPKTAGTSVEEALYCYQDFKYRTSPHAIAKQYKDYIIKHYPNSDMANFFKDPDFFKKQKEGRIAAQKDYLALVKKYEAKEYTVVFNASQNVVDNDKSNALRAEYLLLNVLAAGQLTEDKQSLLPRLNNIIDEKPSTDQAKRAQELIDILKKGYSVNIKILKNDTLLKINWIYFDNDNLDEMKKKIKSIMF